MTHDPQSTAVDGTAADGTAGATFLPLADWRRRNHEVYRKVRGTGDPEQAHARWRRERDELLRTHSQSPLPGGDPLRASGIPYWPYDPALRWTLPVEPVPEPTRRDIDTGADGHTRLRLIGQVTLPFAASPRLGVWWIEQYGGGVFVPVKDGTAGATSYGGGRYLLDTAKGADLGGSATELTIDLNFLYHPSCRYDPAWTCPLAPAENTIGVPIEAGERMSAAAPAG